MERKDRVTIEPDVVFGRGGGRDLSCDVYTPPTRPASAPGVLLLHGGAWRSGDRTQLRGYGIRLGMAGYVCVAAEYRLAGEAGWPAQIEDTKAAIRWLRANARELGVDPDRIVAQGNSAGGHLALLAAGTPGHEAFEGEGGHPDVPTDVAAVVAIYPPTRLPRVPTQMFAAADGPALDPGGGDRDDEAAHQASPTSHVTGSFPPTLLIHGDADEVVPVEASLVMHRTLREAGVPVELHLYPEQPHAFDAQPEFGRRCAAKMAFFLDRYVGGATTPD